jgi:hypothetical protein
MKLKFPKTIKVGSEVFEVRLDKKNVDAEFAFAFEGKPAFIRIGIEDLKVSKLCVLERIIHELKEIIQVEQRVRYRKSDDNAYEFHYGHREHTQFCGQLAGLLDEFIK